MVFTINRVKIFGFHNHNSIGLLMDLFRFRRVISEFERRIVDLCLIAARSASFGLFSALLEHLNRSPASARKRKRIAFWNLPVGRRVELNANGVVN